MGIEGSVMRFEIDKDKLRDLAQFYSDAKIGKMYDISAEVIRRRRNEYDIKPGKRSCFDPDKEVLENLYQNMSMKQIAQKYDVGETIVWKRLKELGIRLKGYENGGHRRKGRTFSDSHLANLRKAAKARRGKYTGENSPHWKGGVSGSSGSDRRTGQHKEWKRLVLEKADYQCEECGKKHGRYCSCCGEKVVLHIHHIKPYSKYPELRYDVKNGKALCSLCHYKVHF